MIFHVLTAESKKILPDSIWCLTPESSSWRKSLRKGPILSIEVRNRDNKKKTEGRLNTNRAKKTYMFVRFMAETVKL